MYTILRLLGTNAAAGDRAVAVIDSITIAQLRDLALGLTAIAVVLIDLALIAVIMGAGQ